MTVNYAAPLEPDEMDDIEVDEPVVKPKPRRRRKGMLFAGIGLIVVAVIAIAAGLSYVAPEFVSEAQFQDVRNHAYDVDDSGQEEGDRGVRQTHGAACRGRPGLQWKMLHQHVRL